MAGEFDLAPIIKEKWQFIMIESFPNWHTGQFVARAAGYEEQTFTASYSPPRIIEMTLIR